MKDYITFQGVVLDLDYIIGFAKSIYTYDEPVKNESDKEISAINAVVRVSVPALTIYVKDNVPIQVAFTSDAERDHYYKYFETCVGARKLCPKYITPSKES